MSENRQIAYGIESLKKYPVFTTKARGWSMRPFIEHDRDDLIFGRMQRPPRIGDVLLCELGHHVYVCHRVVAIDGDRLTLRGDGNVKGVEHCIVGDVRAILVKVRRKGRVYDLHTSRTWQVYSYVWTRLTFMRRYLLYIFRACAYINKLIKIK